MNSMTGSLEDKRKEIEEKKLINKKQNDEKNTITLEELEKLRSNSSSIKMFDFNKYLPKDHFINIYTNWTTKITDGYYEYQVLSALWIISALIKHKVYINKYTTQKIRPNLWIYIFGRSTVSRKTTSMMLAKDVYETVKEETVYNKDFSIEGYLKDLEVNPNTDFWRDEAGGLLSNITKNYNKGFFDHECSIYEGISVSKLLKGEQIFVENPCTTEYYGTTFPRYLENVTRDIISIGWGYRYLYANPEYERKERSLSIITEEDKNRFNHVIEIAKQINNKIKELEEDCEYEFDIEPEALDYLNNKKSNITKKYLKLNNCDMDEIIGRYETYASKIAMIIEFGYKEPNTTITKNSMKISLKLIEEYFLPTFQDMMERMQEDVKNNRIEKVVSKLKENGSTIERSELLKKSKLFAREFNEVIATLIESNVIEVKNLSNSKKQMIILKANIIKNDKKTLRDDIIEKNNKIIIDKLKNKFNNNARKSELLKYTRLNAEEFNKSIMLLVKSNIIEIIKTNDSNVTTIALKI